MKNRIINTYRPIIEEYKEKYVRNSLPLDISAPHIPGIGKEYKASEFKICYVGVDTYKWIDTEYAINNTEDYILSASNALRNYDHINIWSKKS